VRASSSKDSERIAELGVETADAGERGLQAPNKVLCVSATLQRKRRMGPVYLRLIRAHARTDTDLWG
jgi:hypothetical protein